VTQGVLRHLLRLGRFAILSAEMDPASSGQPAHGIIFAPLVEVHSDRIVVGDHILFLRDGQNCTHALGTSLEVAYTLTNGCAKVDHIAVVKPSR
jgi:hypothetical protein